MYLFIYLREKIFGYKDLIVKMYYTASSLKLYINITYSSKIDTEQFNIIVSIFIFKLEKLISLIKVV